MFLKKWRYAGKSIDRSGSEITTIDDGVSLSRLRTRCFNALDRHDTSDRYHQRIQSQIVKYFQ